MDAIDWNADATLHVRDDDGSEMQYNFTKLGQGPLRDLVSRVAAMSADERARLVINVAGGKSLNVQEIIALAKQEGIA